MRDRIMVRAALPGDSGMASLCAGPDRRHLAGAVAARAIVAGSVLTDKDVRTEQRDISELPPGYMDDPAVAVGLTASRPISSGAVITNQYLVAAKAVQRGQVGDPGRRCRVA